MYDIEKYFKNNTVRFIHNWITYYIKVYGRFFHVVIARIDAKDDIFGKQN